MAASGLHISISAETITHVGGLAVSNSMLTSLVVSTLLIALAVTVNAQLKRSNRPTGLQNFLEFVIESLLNLVQGITNDAHKTKRFFPFIATFFLWILLNNWLGLLPGVGTIGFRETAESQHADLLVSQVQAQDDHVVDDQEANPTAQPTTNLDTTNETGEVHVEATSESGTEADEHSQPAFVPYFRAGTADLNTTIALALISVIMTQVMGVSYLSLGYFAKFFNFSSPIMFFVGILELISEVGKILSFAFRLFGNVFAGEVLLVVITFLGKVIVPMPFYGLEIFVGFIQALVFALLTTVFFNMATQSHDEH